MNFPRMIPNEEVSGSTLCYLQSLLNLFENKYIRNKQFI